MYVKKRMTPRFPFSADAEIILRDGKSLPAQVTELSARGCYLDTLEFVPLGEELQLSICDPTTACEVHGKVIYEHSGGGLGVVGMGVVFGEMDQQQHSTIDAWLRRASGAPDEATIPN
jgi:hypothetical protein